jgi:hypothetical protein
MTASSLIGFSTAAKTKDGTTRNRTEVMTPSAPTPTTAALKTSPSAAVSRRSIPQPSTKEMATT